VSLALITSHVIDKDRSTDHFRHEEPTIRWLQERKSTTRHYAAFRNLGDKLMSMTSHTITRRTVVAATAAAAGMVMPSQAKADDELPLRGPYRIEDWGKTWRSPNKARVLARVPAIALPNIAGYWPQTTRPVRGPQEYAKRILDLLDFIPDFRAEPIEHATNGDVMFVRWIARGTGPTGAFEAVGVDRLIVPNGYVAENLILSDHPIFADFARHVGDFRGASPL
jgi:hypothetical protein